MGSNQRYLDWDTLDAFIAPPNQSNFIIPLHKIHNLNRIKKLFKTFSGIKDVHIYVRSLQFRLKDKGIRREQR